MESVNLESASLSILGTGGVKGMEIGNPENGDFSSPFAFKLGEAFVSVNVGYYFRKDCRQ